MSYEIGPMSRIADLMEELPTAPAARCNLCGYQYGSRGHVTSCQFRHGRLPGVRTSRQGADGLTTSQRAARAARAAR